MSAFKFVDISSIIHGIGSCRGPVAPENTGAGGSRVGHYEESDCFKRKNGRISGTRAINWDRNDTDNNLGDPCARNESAFLKRGGGAEERKKEKKYR